MRSAWSIARSTLANVCNETISTYMEITFENSTSDVQSLLCAVIELEHNREPTSNPTRYYSVCVSVCDRVQTVVYDNNRRWFYYRRKSSRRRWPEGGNNIVIDVVYDSATWRYHRTRTTKCNNATLVYAYTT